MPPKRIVKNRKTLPEEDGATSQAPVPVNQPAGSSDQGATAGTVVPRAGRGAAVAGRGQKILAPKGYTMRPVQPAKNYDVISFARAMNDDFGPRVKKLFDPEREAALAAQNTGIYIGWRCPEFTWDCQRVGDNSRCFCGHNLNQHAKYSSKSVRVPCGQCACKAYAWVPARPEEIGEFWFARRRNFDVTTWRAKCRCKHTHEEHDPNGSHRCKASGCRCTIFDSSFLCAACDRHWNDHDTFFEDTETRQKNGLPVGADYLPFAEIPSLRNMVLTGEDDEDMSYMKVLESPYAQPLPKNAITDNSRPVRGQNSLEYGCPGGVCPRNANADDTVPGQCPGGVCPLPRGHGTPRPGPSLGGGGGGGYTDANIGEGFYTQDRRRVMPSPEAEINWDETPVRDGRGGRFKRGGPAQRDYQ